MAQRATSLGPKPSLFFCYPFLFFIFAVFLICFPFFAFNRTTLFPPPPPKKKAFLIIFLCLPLFLFGFFWASPFFIFSFFVSLSLSLSCFCPSSFLPVSHVSFWFLFFVFVLFASCFKMLFWFCFLIVVLLCSESLYLIWFCFASYFLGVVVFVFVVFVFSFLASYQKTSLKTLGIAKKTKKTNAENTKWTF